MACNVRSEFIPSCGVDPVSILKRSTPPDLSLILPGDLLTWTFTIDASANLGVGVSFEDIFDDCYYLDMSSITVSAPWTVTPDGGNPCRLIFDNPAAVTPGIFTCTMTAIAGAPGPLPLLGYGTIRNTANVLVPAPAAGNPVELIFGPLLVGAVGDRAIGVPMSYTYTITSGDLGAVAVTLFAGALPDGLSISPAGVLSGTPTVADDFDFTLRLTDGLGNTYDLSDECLVS